MAYLGAFMLLLIFSKNGQMLPNQRIFAQDLTTCATSKTVSLGTKNQARHKNTQELTQQWNQSLQLNLVFHELRYKHCKASKKAQMFGSFLSRCQIYAGRVSQINKTKFWPRVHPKEGVIFWHVNTIIDAEGLHSGASQLRKGMVDELLTNACQNDL